MGLTESLVFYAVIGVAVAAAVWLTGEAAGGGQRIFQTLTSVLFWPLYVPVLLARPSGALAKPPAPRPPADEMAQAIAQVELELDTALSSLDGWAENVLAREKDRLSELRGALAAEAQRIREMDQLIAHAALGEQLDLSAARLVPGTRGRNGEGIQRKRRSSGATMDWRAKRSPGGASTKPWPRRWASSLPAWCGSMPGCEAALKRCERHAMRRAANWQHSPPCTPWPKLGGRSALAAQRTKRERLQDSSG